MELPESASIRFPLRPPGLRALVDPRICGQRRRGQATPPPALDHAPMSIGPPHWRRLHPLPALDHTPRFINPAHLRRCRPFVRPCPPQTPPLAPRLRLLLLAPPLTHLVPAPQPIDSSLCFRLHPLFTQAPPLRIPLPSSQHSCCQRLCKRPRVALPGSKQRANEMEWNDKKAPENQMKPSPFRRQAGRQQQPAGNEGWPEEETSENRRRETPTGARDENISG